MLKPLTGVRVIEFAGLGPLEHAGMLLADLGAEVLRITRSPLSGPSNPIHRGRTTKVLDLKQPADRDFVLAEISQSDVVLEGMRPGVMERLGLGPDDVAAHNPTIIYGRMTGWGQTGPLSARAGHDINYLAETGALWATRGSDGRPAIPLNVVGDMGGGALYLVVGVLAAIVQQPRQGAVIDAAIVDGVSSLLQCVHGLRARAEWSDETRDNLFDGGRPWYDIYPCSDGRYIAVGALEPQFYEQLLHGLGLDHGRMPDRSDPGHWSEIRVQLGAAFLTRTRDEWAEHLYAYDACASPVLSITEATQSNHLASRGTMQLTPDGWSASVAPRIEKLSPTKTYEQEGNLSD